MERIEKMKKILLIDAHPNNESFCASLADVYWNGAKESNYDIKRLNLRELKFDLNLHKGYQTIQELEPDLVDAQNKIKWCDHLVVVYPIWWGSMPALLKGFLDRCWLPGFAFQYHKNDPFWDKLLKGRSARIIVTSDAPFIYNLLGYMYAPYLVMKKTILKFCGFKPVKLTAIGRVKHLSETQRESFLRKISKLGANGL